MARDVTSRRPQRQTPDLLKGRVSVPGAVYFVTFCTEQRRPMLATTAARAAAFAACREQEEAGDARFLAVTLMPDHAHLLWVLGERLNLDRVIAKWKSRMRRALGEALWQANFFEHRLRPDKAAEPYAWYMFLNPYRAGLVSVDEPWPGWWSTAGWRFLELARPGPCPQPEWLDQFEERTAGLVSGE